MSRLTWEPLIARAADIVAEYDIPVTLRQVYYRLVAEGAIPNVESSYKRLSELSAKARREGRFPDLYDRTRSIDRLPWWDSPQEAMQALRDQYRRDRTSGQAWSLYLGVEKNALAGLLGAWFHDTGIPIVALGGYASQTFVDEVARDVTRAARPAVLLYGGDFDPSGEDIDRDFAQRVGFDEVQRVALNAEQVRTYGLPPAMGKASDSRAGAFEARHGRLVQVELDALDPNDLRGLYQQAIDAYWDVSAYEAVLAQEQADREVLE